jgi:hypothetical protein
LVDKTPPIPVYLHLANLIATKAAVARKYAGGMNPDDADEHRAIGIELFLAIRSM